jgi:hypothetical protein
MPLSHERDNLILKEHLMPAYEIRYLDDKGRLVHHFNAECESDVKAKVTAHAMKSLRDCGLEVWFSGALIYRRAASMLPAGTLGFPDGA